jgi:predicted membrane protein
MARSAGAAMIVGAIACLVHGLGLRGKRPPVRVLTHPSVAWTLAVTGLIASSLV